MTKKLTEQQTLRYSRQILIPGFDQEGQEALFNARVLQIGAGGLGCASAQYLVAAGIGSLILVDDDQVEISNLQRQVLHRETAIGEAKVASAKQALRQINSECDIQIHCQRLDEAVTNELVRNCDIIVDCSDNLSTRSLLNRAAVYYLRPLVSGAAIRMEGQITTVIPGNEAPCYACLSTLFTEPRITCVESGIMSPVVGVIGSMQALEAIKVLSGFGTPLQGRLLLFDAMMGSWQQFMIPKRPNCEVCR